jgi:hypothetical protein
MHYRMLYASSMNMRLDCFVGVYSASNVLRCSSTSSILLVLDQAFTRRLTPEESVKVWRLVVDFAQSFVNAFNLSMDSSLVKLVTTCCNNSNTYYFSTMPLNCMGRDFSDSVGVACIQRSVQSRKQLIILTEADNVSDAAVTLLHSLRASGMEIFFIAVGNAVDSGRIKTMASLPLESHYIQIDEYGKLRDILPAFIGATCNTSQSSSKKGGRLKLFLISR